MRWDGDETYTGEITELLDAIRELQRDNLRMHLLYETVPPEVDALTEIERLRAATDEGWVAWRGAAGVADALRVEVEALRAENAALTRECTERAEAQRKLRAEHIASVIQSDAEIARLAALLKLREQQLWGSRPKRQRVSVTAVFNEMRAEGKFQQMVCTRCLQAIEDDDSAVHLPLPGHLGAFHPQCAAEHQVDYQ